ncbi:MAG: hypothetical protein ACR2LX_10645 [Jatrophihabitans sp.]
MLAGCSSSSSTAKPSRGEIATLLARHGSAVVGHKQSQFLDDLAPGRFRSTQQAVFSNLAKVPLSHWSYSIGPTVDAADAQSAARKKFGASALIVRVTLSYALQGVDRTPTTHDLWWTFIRRDGAVRVVNDSDLAMSGGKSWQGPWDFGALDVVRGAASIVLGHAGNHAVLVTAAATVDTAIPVVTSVWGPGWPRQVAVFVPSSPTELAAALGPTSSITAPVGAIASSDGQDAVSGAVRGQRLVVEAEPFGRLSPVGQRIVLQHEITHIADAAATTDASPRWLVEGFAEYVGNLRSGQTVKQAALELGRDVRAGKVPAGLPADASFDTSGTAAQAYQSSWLACRLIARQVGANGLVRFYRQVGASPDASDQAAAAGVRSILHVSPAQFLSQFRSYVHEQLS